MILASALAVGLVVYSVVTNRHPTGHATYILRNLATGALLVLLARWAGLGWELLGLGAGHVAAGLRWGWLAVLVVAVGVAAGAALADRIPAVARLLADRRADLEPSELAFHASVRIPVGTALFEEVAFRGVLLGAFLATTSTVLAVAVSSVAFGLWHVVPTLQTLSINDVEDRSARRGTVVAAVVATTLAGVVLAVLRLVSGSVVAPVLAHAAINSLGLLAAALHRRTSR